MFELGGVFFVYFFVFFYGIFVDGVVVCFCLLNKELMIGWFVNWYDIVFVGGFVVYKFNWDVFIYVCNVCCFLINDGDMCEFNVIGEVEVLKCVIGFCLENKI